MQDTGPGNGKNAGWYEAGMPRVLAQLLPLGRLPGSLARGICQAWVSGSLGGHLDGAWVSGSLADTWTVPGSLARFTSKKFLRFLNSQELFFTQSQSRPTETLFTAQSGLTRELLTSKFHIDPRTSLRMPPELSIPLLSALVPATTSLLHKIFFDQSLHISHIQWIFLRLKS